MSDKVKIEVTVEAAEAESEIRPTSRQQTDAEDAAPDSEAPAPSKPDTDFLNEDTAWRCIEGKAIKMAVGNLNTLWCLSPPYGAVWEYKWHGLEGSECINLNDSKGRWHPHPGEDLRWIDVGTDGAVWGLTHEGKPLEFEWDMKGWRGHWNLLPTCGEEMVQVGVGKDGVWAMSNDGLPYQWDQENDGWTPMAPPSSGKIKSIVCGSDGETWSLDKNGYSYRYDPEFDWVKVGDMSLHKLAVGSRQRVYGIGGVRNYVWKYNTSQDRWTHMVTPCPFIDIAAGADGSVWCIDKQKRIWWLYD